MEQYDRFIEDNELRLHARISLMEELTYKIEALTKKAFRHDAQVILNEDDWTGQLVVKYSDVRKILEGK